VTTLQKFIARSTIVFVVSAACGIAAAGSSSDDPVAVANEAIAQLAGWQTKAARKTLQANKKKLGSTSEFKTAWALLEIQEAMADGKPASGNAISSVGKAAKTQDVDPIAHYWEGELYYQQSKNKEASAAWQAAATSAEKLVAADPSNATAQFYLGAALVRQKKYEPALKALDRAEKGGFDEAMVNQQIGFAYLFQQEWKEAKDAFDAGLKADARFAPLYFWRAMAWDKLGRKDNMMIDLDQYLKLAPDGYEAGKARAVLKSTGG
jgi:tetratricopeptide (TPR) repeat protein